MQRRRNNGETLKLMSFQGAEKSRVEMPQLSTHKIDTCAYNLETHINKHQKVKNKSFEPVIFRFNQVLAEFLGQFLMNISAQQMFW